MVIILQKYIHEDDKARLKKQLEDHGYAVREINGSEESILGAVGPQRLDLQDVEALPGVQKVLPISKPFKLASRELQREDSVVDLGPVKIGGGRIVMVAGPPVIEGRDQIFAAARTVREAGGAILQGSAFFRPVNPYGFKGMGEAGLRHLHDAGREFHIPVMTEIDSISHLPMMRELVDIIRISGRHMQNYELLKALAESSMPLLLERSVSATIEEWLMSAEYLLSSGAEKLVLCEAGIRSFETATRLSLDISSIPVVKKLSHLPIMVDSSLATGIRDKVLPLSMAAIAAGADGFLADVHPDPDTAAVEGGRCLHPAQLAKLAEDAEALCPVLHKEMARLPRIPGSPGFPGPGFVPSPVANAAGEGHGAGKKLHVAFQGEPGAYSEMALRKYFSAALPGLQTMPCTDFKHAFQKVLDGEADYAILPIENALTGSIHENYDLLLQFPDISICGETRIRIRHSLIGLPGAKIEQIRQVFSHPQGLAQSSRFLEAHPGMEPRPFYDTAGSVAHIAKTGRMEYAAIAHSGAADVYGMAVLVEGIETNPSNYTRFVVIRRAGPEGSVTPDKASLVFSAKDRPGALLSCMERLSVRGFNLTKLESRPIHGKPWEYMFYLDVDVSAKLEEFRQALAEMGEFADEIRVLGYYSRG